VKESLVVVLSLLTRAKSISVGFPGHAIFELALRPCMIKKKHLSFGAGIGLTYEVREMRILKAPRFSRLTE
jgi:hypothetical protein